MVLYHPTWSHNILLVFWSKWLAKKHCFAEFFHIGEVIWREQIKYCLCNSVPLLRNTKSCMIMKRSNQRLLTPPGPFRRYFVIPFLSRFKGISYFYCISVCSSFFSCLCCSFCPCFSIWAVSCLCVPLPKVTVNKPYCPGSSGFSVGSELSFGVTEHASALALQTASFSAIHCLKIVYWTFH